MANDTKDPQSNEGRDATTGRFKPGFRGGPGGSRKPPEDVVEMWKAATPKATMRIIEALDAEKPVVVADGREAGSHVEMVPDHDMRLKAAEVLYSRQWGKPSQAITGDEGGPISLGLVILPSESDE